MFTNLFPGASFVWVGASGHTYGLYKSSKTWVDASFYASSVGGYLAKVDTSAENTEIYNQVKTTWDTTATNASVAPDGGSASYVWLGASDSVIEGSWKWAKDGSALTTSRPEWGSGGGIIEPDDAGGTQDYLAMGMETWPWVGFNPGFVIGNPGQWNDISGDNKLYFVVEKDTIVYAGGTGGISQVNFLARFSQASVQATGSTMAVQLANGESYIFENHDLLQFTDRTISIAEVAAQQDPDAVFRFYNTTTGTHFYTGSAAEADSVVRNLELFNFEGVAFDKNSVVGGDSLDVFRFYNKTTGTHFYTGSVTEKNSVIANLPNFNYEGVAYQAHSTESSGTTELYRFYNTQTGTHFYTASEAEMQNVKTTLSGVYNYEGVAYYVDVA